MDTDKVYVIIGNGMLWCRGGGSGGSNQGFRKTKLHVAAQFSTSERARTKLEDQTTTARNQLESYLAQTPSTDGSYPSAEYVTYWVNYWREQLAAYEAARVTEVILTAQ